MPKITPIRNNFNGGELSPKVDFRVDVNKYHSGCTTLENFIPLVEGGVVRMPGSVFVVASKDSTKASRTVSFHFSTTQAYVLEFGNLYIRFYKDEAQIVDGTPVEVVTPYLEAELFDLKFTQSADVLYIFHPSHAPRKLTRTSHTAWTLTTITFRPPPTNELGFKPATTLTLAAVTGKNITFTAGASAFLNGDIGRVITSGAGRASIIAYTSATVVSCDILDDFAAVGPIASQSWTIEGSPVQSVTPSDSSPIGAICTLTSASANIFRSGDVGKYIYINNGSVKIITYSSGTEVKGEIMQELTSTDASTAWTLEEEIWNATNGYPSCGTFFEQRLAVSGVPGFPQTVYLSVSADYENFAKDPDLDDAALEYTIVSPRVDKIQWLVGYDYLMIGTVGGIWKFGASVSTEPLTQLNVSAKKQITSSGVKNIQPEPVTDSLMWVTRSGKTLRSFVYDFAKDKFISPDMMRVAKHIAHGSTLALSGIVDMAFQSEPQPILWCVRADGQLLGLTYETSEEVFAWFRVVTSGSFESVSVISDENEEDQIWCIVNRTINGSTVRYVEYFKPIEFYSILKNSFFLHSGISYDGGAAVTITGITNANPAVVTAVNTFSNGNTVRIKDVVGMTEVNQGLTKAYTVANATGTTFELSGIDSTGWGKWTSGGTAQAVKKTFTTLTHLEGETVYSLIDGSPAPTEVVSSGSVTLDWYGNVVHVGLHRQAVLKPTKPHVETRQGTLRGKKQKINELIVTFYETLGGKTGPDTDNLKSIKFGTGSPALFTGDKHIDFWGNWGDESTIVIVQDQPLPMTVLGITPSVNYNED